MNIFIIFFTICFIFFINIILFFFFLIWLWKRWFLFLFFFLFNILIYIIWIIKFYINIIIFYIILPFFGFYEDNLLDIKKIIKRINVSSKIIKEVHNCILIKIILFFIISYILSICFWIYIGCFCAVYKNTQIHLLKEVIFSFLVSFISPFFYYLIPGILRIPSFDLTISVQWIISSLFCFIKILIFVLPC